LKAKNLNHDNSIDEKNRCIKLLEGEVNLLKQKTRNDAQEKSILQGRLEQFDSLETETENLQFELDSLLTRNTALEASMRGKDTTISDLKEDNDRLVVVIAQLRKDVSNTKEKMIEEQRWKEEAQETVAVLSNEVNELKNEISKYNAARALFVQSTEAQAGVQVGPNPFTPRGGSSSNKRRKTTPTSNV
jgi:chromosome segregation ATPase